MKHLVAVNAYRTSTSHGFTNTWGVFRCKDREHQKIVLRDGLPVRDAMRIDSDGRRSPVLSTMGVRPATNSERKRANRKPETVRALEDSAF